jgi:hypothetical protein
MYGSKSPLFFGKNPFVHGIWKIASTCYFPNFLINYKDTYYKQNLTHRLTSFSPILSKKNSLIF